jgi:hypothetical protein
MRHLAAVTTAALALGLAACSSNTSFNKTQGDVYTPAGDPGVTVDPLEVVFTDLTVGSTYSQYVTFTASGEGDLIVYRFAPVEDYSSAFDTRGVEDAVTIPSGASEDFIVLAVLPEDAPATALLQVQTNVSDLLEFNIPVSAYPVGWTGGDTAGGDTADSGL